MSRILKRIRDKKKIVAILSVILVMALVAVLGAVFHLGILYYIVFYTLIIIVFFLTYAVRKKMNKMSAPFGTFSNVRNVDYLIIGDFCRADDYVPQGATYVQISAPGRNLNSSFQILLQTHSILKEEGGNVVIPLGDSKKEFMIFDMPFLHPITVKKYHLERLRSMSRLAFIFSPINSIRFLIGGGVYDICTCTEC